MLCIYLSLHNWLLGYDQSMHSADVLGLCWDCAWHLIEHGILVCGWILLLHLYMSRHVLYWVLISSNVELQLSLINGMLTEFTFICRSRESAMFWHLEKMREPSSTWRRSCPTVWAKWCRASTLSIWIVQYMFK